MSKPTSEREQLTERLDARVEMLAGESKDSPRRFRMVAYTGAEFDRWYGRVVIDLDGIDGPEKLPILLNHRDGDVVGFADARRVTKAGLELEGVISRATECGREVAQLSDEGFPFTASVGVSVLSREELTDGATSKVNGRDVRGPLTIWRKTRLGETSFVTAFPADKDTEAYALMSKTAQQLMQQNLPAQADVATPPAPTHEELRAQGAKAEQERLARLQAAIPGRTEFVMAQFLAGADVLQAKAALADLLLKEQAESAAKQADKDALLRQVPGGTGHNEILTLHGVDRQADATLSTEKLMHLPVQVAAERLMKTSRLYDEAFRGDKRALELYLNAERNMFLRGMDYAAQALNEESQRKIAGIVNRGLLGLNGREVLASWGKSNPDYAAITVKGIIGTFYKALEDDISGNWAARIGALMPSNQETESYKWLGNTPQLREWLGSRLEKGVPIRSYSITNKVYEATMPIDVEDYRFDKTGQIMVRIAEMAKRIGQHWQSLLSTLIEANSTAWDGVAMFATTHSMGGDYTTSQSNLLTSSNYAELNVAAPSSPTRNELISVVLKLVEHLFTLKDNQGEPYNSGAREFTLMVPVNMYGAAMGATRDSLVNSGESNLLKSQDFDVKVIPNERLTSTSVLYLFRSDSFMKPFILQEAEGVQMQFQGPGSHDEFHKNKYSYGAKVVRNAGNGEWAHAVKATLS